MRLGISIFSFISHDDLPRLCEKIEILVRDSDLKGVVRHNSALNLYRYRIADGVESHSKCYHKDCDYECTRAS